MAEAETMTDPNHRGRLRRAVPWLLAAIFLVPTAIGFGYKLYQFYHTMKTDVYGAFTILPILTYVSVAAGLLCLFIWAVLRGMFTDIEGPKYTLLENEKRIDQQSALQARPAHHD